MPKAISSELLRKRKQEQQQFDNRSKQNESKKKSYYSSYCSVPGCGKFDSKVGTFTIPKVDHIKAHWLNFLQICGKKIDPERKSYKICERHFEAKFVMTNGMRKKLMFCGKPTLDVKTMVRFLSLLKR